MKVRLLALLFPFIGCSPLELACDLTSEIEHRINSGINKGIAIAFIDSLGTVKYFNIGYEDKDRSEITEQSIFEIASVSKTFTTTLIKRLHLKVEQEIRGFLPDSLPEQIKQIKLEELINHTSGLPRLPPDYWTSNWDDPFSDHDEEKLMASLMSAQLDSTKKWNYSNLGYALLGFILDERTNDNGLEAMISSMNLESTVIVKLNRL